MNGIDLIRGFLAERLDVNAADVQPDALLVDLGVDSLMLAELMFEAEDRLGIQIAANQAPPTTVGDMVAVIESLTSAKSG